jgi:hypothetical protein
MRTLNYVLSLSVGVCLLSGCPDNGGGGGEDMAMMMGGDMAMVSPDMSPNLPGVEITTDTVWSGEKTLETYYFVRSGTLTIMPGTTVKGGTAQKSALIVMPGAKIYAVGTPNMPIVFTSDKAPGTRAPSDWGGVILLGNAKVNSTFMGLKPGQQLIEGFDAAERRVMYGAKDDGTTNDAHDCGKMKYVRIEFAGQVQTQNRETNGLTMGGCGSATEIDFVHVHKASDDGVEIFGGTVNIKHILITQAEDDGLDWDFGWTGKAQFMIIQQSHNHGMECDSNTASPNASPRSKPLLYNVSLIGVAPQPGKESDHRAVQLRSGTGIRFFNSIVMGWGSVSAMKGYHIDAKEPVAAAEISVKSTMFFGNYMDGMDDGSSTDGYDEAAMMLNAPGANNLVGTDPTLTDANNLTAPKFYPAAPITATPREPLPGGDTFFSPADFIGAMADNTGTNDWTAGWTAFPPN